MSKTFIEPEVPHPPQRLTASEQAIPKRIHQIWLGGELPEVFARYAKRLQELHPQWEYTLWREQDLDWLTHKADFDRVPKFATKANIARYEVIHRFGGVYFDTDFEPLRPIDELLTDCTMAVCPSRHGELNNAFFAATPGHPVLGWMLERMTESIDANFGHNGSPQMCGFQFFTRSVERACAITGEKVKWLPRHVFYPYNFDQPEFNESTLFPDSYAIHRWDGSWFTPPSQPKPRESRRLKLPMKAWLLRLIGQIRSRLIGDLFETPPLIRQALPVGNGRILCAVEGRFSLLVAASDLNLLPNLFLHGRSDQKYFRFIEAVLRRSDTVLDIGANIGLTVLASAWRLGPYGTVHAFEPNADCLALLRDNLYMNYNLGLKAEVVVHPVAIGARDEAGLLTASNRHLGRGSLSASIAQRAENEIGDTRQTTVPLRRLRSVLHGVQHMRLVKIDVEGFEHEVLESLQPWLATQSIDFLDIEINSAHSGRNWPTLVSGIRALAANHGMEPHRITGEGRLMPLSVSALIEGPSHDHVVFANRRVLSDTLLAGTPANR